MVQRYAFIFVCVVFVVVVAWVLFSLFLKGNLCNYTNKTKKFRLRRAINAIVVYIIYTTMKFQKSLTIFSGASSRERTQLYFWVSIIIISSADVCVCVIPKRLNEWIVARTTYTECTS